MKEKKPEAKNRITAILRQRDGATIVFALAVFLIAAIASATIVSVAMANLNRVALRRSNEQERLAVMSAAKYLESEGDTDLKTALDNLHSATDLGKKWKVTVNNEDADDALETTIEWKSISDGSSLSAIISTAGGYSTEVRLNYNAIDDKWEISKLIKHTEG